MPAPQLSREDVVHRLLGAFRRFAYDAASLAQLPHARLLLADDSQPASERLEQAIQGLNSAIRDIRSYFSTCGRAS